jgi:carbonic anhydrase
MNELIGRVFSFEKTVFPKSSELYGQLSTHGQAPKALMISCADRASCPNRSCRRSPATCSCAATPATWCRPIPP